MSTKENGGPYPCDCEWPCPYGHKEPTREPSFKDIEDAIQIVTGECEDEPPPEVTGEDWHDN